MHKTNIYQVADVMSDLEVAISASAFCMDNSLRNTLAVEMGEKINQVEVLEQQRTILQEFPNQHFLMHEKGLAICC